MTIKKTTASRKDNGYSVKKKLKYFCNVLLVRLCRRIY